MTEIPKDAVRCLDKGFVRLVDSMGGDDAIVQAARVSYGKGTSKVSQDRGLIRDLMRDQIVMPSHLMKDGTGSDLFEQFSTIAQQLGVYTAKHYAEIVEHLVRRWNVEHLTGLTGEAVEAQDYLCRLGARYAKLAERSERRQSKVEPRQFSWIFNRAV